MIYFIFNGNIIGVEKLNVMQIIQLGKNIKYLEDIRVFFVNLVENKYIVFEKDAKLDFITLLLALFCFLSVNGIAAYITMPNKIKPDVLDITNIIISIPENDDKTVKFTYSELISNGKLLHIFAELFLVSSDSVEILLSKYVHPEYSIVFNNYNITFDLPSFIRQGFVNMRKVAIDYSSPDTLKQLYRFLFYYSLKSKQNLKLDELYPEDISILQDILKSYIEAERKEYEKIEREQKKIKNK